VFAATSDATMADDMDDYYDDDYNYFYIEDAYGIAVSSRGC
jgi:hypothetical protein